MGNVKKMLDHDMYEFWKEIKVTNRCNPPLPNNMEGIVGNDKIAQLWRNCYNIFSCLPSNIENVIVNVNTEVSPSDSQEEVKCAILKLVNGKSCAIDHIYTELKQHKLHPFPFNMLFRAVGPWNGALPDSLVAVVLVPIIKNKTGRINIIDNYKAIAPANVVQCL